MSPDVPYSRRELLKAVGTSAIGGLAASGRRHSSKGPIESNSTTKFADSQRQTRNSSPEHQFDVGGLYYLKYWDCVDGEPDVGGYGSPPKRETVAEHVNQFTTFNLNRLVALLPSGAEPSDQIYQLLSDFTDEVTIEIAYNANPALDGDRSVTDDLNAISSIIDKLSKYSTIDDRPVVTITNLTEYRDGPTLHAGIDSQFDSPEAFLKTVRDSLKQHIATEPFLIGELGRFGKQYQSNIGTEYLEFAAEFEAISNRVWDVFAGTVSRETAYSENLKIYRGARDFADAHDMDFVPVVYPGLNELTQNCTESSKRIPRDTVLLRDLLDVANLFGTMDRVLIDAFNDWFHGKQIEPGRLGTTNYGTDYLESISDFQRSEPMDIDDQIGSRSLYYVDPNGAEVNAGSVGDPLASLQHALLLAEPGQGVRLLPGEYYTPAETARGGEAGQPITIEGSPEARVHARLDIRHSHIHLLGLWFDGLTNRDDPENPASYRGKNIVVNPGADSNEYLTDVKVKPHAVGNTVSPPVRVSRTKHSEIGEFEVIGPAGVGYLYGDQQGHNGEIVKIGKPPDNLDPGEEIDQSSDIHVHHIANTEGHPHNELVEAEPGTYNILIEYCTDAGGSAKFRRNENESPSGEAAMGIRGGSSTVRWCIITDSHGAGIDIGVGGVESRAEAFEEVPDKHFPGKQNSIYGNRLNNNQGIALKYETVGPGTSIDAGPEDQKAVCGNEYDGETMDDPGRACPDWVPKSEEIGHFGGDSPWINDLSPIGGNDSKPTDPDDDRRYEDIDGDGEFSIVDVQSLFTERDSTVIANNTEKFDFSGDGRFSISDIQQLFSMLKER